MLLSQAWRGGRAAGDVAVVSLPWLRDVDGAWLADGRPATRRSSCSTTTSPRGGQGDAVRAALAGAARSHVWASRACPACGTNDEVLRAHGLDAGSLAARLEAL